MTKGWRAAFTITFLALFSLLALDVYQWWSKGDGVELTVWNMPVEGRDNDQELWLSALRSFEKGPGRGIKVKPIARKYIQQQFTTVMASGKGPDVVHVPVGALPTLARHGFLAPLDKEIKRWDARDAVKNLQWEAATVDNHIYGVPYDSYFLTLLIRKDLYTQAGFSAAWPPETWKELAQAARKMTKPERGQYGFGFSPTTDQFMDFVWQAGGDLIRWDNNQWRATFHQNPGIAALTFLRDLRFKQKVMQPNPLANQDELLQLFALGQLGMILGVANQMPDLISRYGMRNEDLIIAPLPVGPSGIRASHSGGDYFVINAQSDAATKKAAWAYVEHILSPINQIKKFRAMNKKGMSVYPGAFSVTANLTNDPKFHLVRDALTYARVEPHPQNWPLVKDQLDSMVLQKIFLDPDADVEETLADAAEEIEDRFF